MSAFPRRVPLFPLPNCVLFPDVTLPLHVFEPRYRAMTRDVLDGEGVIGMVLLQPGSDAAARRAPIFPVGCGGRVVESRELPDGRFDLLLAGERRFRVRSEEPTPRPYRVADVELIEDPGFEALGPGQLKELEGFRARIEEAVLEVARASDRRAVGALERRMRVLDPVQLVHALAFALDASPLEKQGLLEAADPVERARLLLRLLAFREAERRHPDISGRLN